MNKIKIFVNGFIKENPTFVLLLGMCPTLGTTGSAINGMSMGLATASVLIFSNMAIAAIHSQHSARQSAHPRLHRGDSVVRVAPADAYAGLRPRPLQHIGNLHPADCRELHPARTCRGFRLEARRYRLALRRARHRTRLHCSPDAARVGTRVSRHRQGVRTGNIPRKLCAVAVHPCTGRVHSARSAHRISQQT